MREHRPTYQELVHEWKALRETHDIRVREVACVGAPRTLLCVDCGDATLPAIALSAGVHGDEPAGPLALLDLVRDERLDPHFSYRIWPCLNPTGFDAGTRTNGDGIDVNRSFGRGGSSPEARAVVTANRDYKFVLSIDLHEDDETCGFYCYAYGAAQGERLIAEVREREIAVDDNACLRPDPRHEVEALGGLSYTLLLIRHATPAAFTFETPSNDRLRSRVATHVAAVEAALSGVLAK